MRKLLLGSALAVVLTVGVHGTSLASTPVPATPEFRLNVAGTIQLNNENPLSNQAHGGDDSGDDSNGNNGSDNGGD